MYILGVVLLSLLYVAIVAVTGCLALKLWWGSRYGTVVTCSAGFLLIQFVSFAVFCIASGLGSTTFLVAFVPDVLLLATLAILAGRKNGFSMAYELKLLAGSFKRGGAFLAIVAFVLAFYFVEARTQLYAAYTDNGTIYQDAIFHAGISRAIIEFGYPIQDIQQAGNIIKYHVLTHYIAAKLSFITNCQPHKVNIFVLPVIGAVFFAALLFHTFSAGWRWKGRGRSLVLAGVGGLTFVATVFFGGTLTTSFVSAFFMSYSYQWQLVVLLIVFSVVQKTLQQGLSPTSIAMLVMLSAVSVIIKGSSLPMLLAGFGGIWLYYFFVDRLKSHRWLLVVVLSTVCCLVVYFAFFVNLTADHGRTDAIAFNYELSNTYPVIIKLGLRNNWISVIVMVVGTLSFRFVIFTRNTPTTWFIVPMLMVGWAFSMLFLNNPLYFLLPSLVLSGCYAMLIVLNSVNIRQFTRVAFAAAILLSIYPVASFGFGFSHRFDGKNKYAPLTGDRTYLYEWLAENTDRESVIFTSSVYVDDKQTADNYYPATLSGRNFFLGGFRFGDQSLSGFEGRRQLVDTFQVSSAEHHERLIREKIRYVLVEFVGNRNPLEYHLPGGPDFSGNDFYTLSVVNPAGCILEVRTTPRQ